MVRTMEGRPRLGEGSGVCAFIEPTPSRPVWCYEKTLGLSNTLPPCGILLD